MPTSSDTDGQGDFRGQTVVRMLSHAVEDSHWESCVAQIGEFFPKANALCTREELGYLLTSHHSLCPSDCAVRMQQTSTLRPGSWKPPLDACVHVNMAHLRGGNPN